MFKNKLTSSGQTITLAVGETYEVKADEVFINGYLYKKNDLEITTQNIHTDNDPEMVKIGIRKRDGITNLPADFVSFNEWEINGASVVSLSVLVETINNILQ